MTEQQSQASPPEIKVWDDGSVRAIAIHRPESRNGLTIESNAALIEALEASARERKVRAVMLTGHGGSFCSGLDLKAAMAMAQGGGGIPQAEERMRKYFHGLIRAVRAVDKPVVAFIDGAAVGFGCDLALACDLRLGTARARLGEVFVRRGLMPDGGATYTLPRIIGVGRALEMMLTGQVVEAEQALAMGLLGRVVNDEAEALAFVQALADGPPLVLRAVKRAVYAALDGTLDEALEAEVRGQMGLLTSRDFAEGLSAFLMKRAPEFKGE